MDVRIERGRTEGDWEAASVVEEEWGKIRCVVKRKKLEATVRGRCSRRRWGLFSQTPSYIGRARKEFRVGNLYLNRGITGALVGRQPFGGFGMSGGGTKAGGKHYLRHFVDPRVVTENTMRRGFAPEE